MQPRARAVRAIVDRHAWTIAGIVAVLHALLGWMTRAPGIFSDQAVYVSLAQSLHAFEYREVFQVGSPVHRMYPPGYPLALALWSAIGGNGFDWLVVSSLASSAIALLFVFAVVQRQWNSVAALISLVAAGTSHTLIAQAGWVLSEPLFIMWTATALWAASRHPDTSRSAALAGTAAILSALTRSAGVTLVIALMITWLWRRQYRRAIVIALASAVTVGAWLTFTALAPTRVPGSSYVEDAVTRPAGTGLASALVTRLSRNVSYVRSVYRMLLPATGGYRVVDAIGAPLLGAGLLAGVFVLARGWPAAAAFLGVYAALLLVWPWRLDRFLVPLVPWLVAAVVLGIGRIGALVGSSWQTPAMCVAAALMVASGSISTAGLVEDRQRCDRSDTLPSQACLGPQLERWADFFTLVRHVRDRAEPGAVFSASSPATLFWFTGHQSLSLTETLNRPPGEFIDYLHTRGATFVLLSSVVPISDGAPLGGNGLADMVKANCDALQLEASAPPSAHLFRVLRAAQGGSSVEACQAADDFIARYGAARR